MHNARHVMFTLTISLHNAALQRQFLRHCRRTVLRKCFLSEVLFVLLDWCPILSGNIECCVICVLAVVVSCHVRRCPQGWVMRLSTGVTSVRRSGDWSRTLYHTTQLSSESFSSGELMDVGESINSLWVKQLFTLQTPQGESIRDFLYRSVTCVQSSYTLRESHKLCQWCRNLRLKLSAGKSCTDLFCSYPDTAELAPRPDGLPAADPGC